MASEDDYEVEYAPRETPKYLRWIIVIAAVLFAFWISSSAFVTVWLNLKEFGELFIRPIYFWLYGGMILSVIALVRFDIINRRSLVFWAIRLLKNLFKSRATMEEGAISLPQTDLSFGTVKLSWSRLIVSAIKKIGIIRIPKRRRVKNLISFVELFNLSQKANIKKHKPAIIKPPITYRVL